jgi:hypothetical protein
VWFPRTRGGAAKTTAPLALQAKRLSQRLIGVPPISIDVLDIWCIRIRLLLVELNRGMTRAVLGTSARAHDRAPIRSPSVQPVDNVQPSGGAAIVHRHLSVAGVARCREADCRGMAFRLILVPLFPLLFKLAVRPSKRRTEVNPEILSGGNTRGLSQPERRGTAEAVA